MRRLLAIATVLVACLAVQATADEPIGPYLQTISVNVTCQSAYGRGVQGSGTLVLSQIRDGDKTHPSAWVLTAHHVVEDQRKVDTVIDREGDEKKQVRYLDCQIIQEQVQGGRGVGEVKYDARVISVDKQRDIALLRLRKDDFGKAGARFYLDEEIPQPGTPLYHCGAPGGKELGGTCSLTSGIVSRLGVRIPEYGGSTHGLYDQITCAALGGSSGGLVALEKDGRWVGMITLGIQGGDSFHWMVPVRSVRQWANEVGVQWLLDQKIDRPTDDDLEKIPLELAVPGFASSNGPHPAPAEAETLHPAPLEREQSEWRRMIVQ